MDLPIKVKLTRPVEHEGETYDTLCFDEPDLAAQIAYSELAASFDHPPSDTDGMRVTRFWISRLAGVPEPVAGKIKASDQDAVIAAMDRIMKVSDAETEGDSDAGNAPPAK